jgi:Na+/H+ antiporter NhaD/arsenite permease-like protein
MTPGIVEMAAAGIFAVALLHTFSTRYFQHLAHVNPAHAGLWHMLGEVEVVFGFWAMVLLLFLTAHSGTHHALRYLESRNFTEPAFVLVIMVIAASRPILNLAGATLHWISRALPVAPPVAYYFTLLSVAPLLGSFITEPAAMTLTALLLRDRFFDPKAPASFLYATIGVLFVNISIGGTLTPYAAPPVLMVADKWGLDLVSMLRWFGWKAAVAVAINAAGVAFLYRQYLRKETAAASTADAQVEVPAWIIGVHLLFLAGVVALSHHPVVFIALFLFFLGFAEAYGQYQQRLILREGLMVAFFLGGLVVLGGQQRWWLQPLLADTSPTALYFGATLLTAITDNAALTYLGSQVQGVSDAFKYAMVAGAVTGGGLTVIANAPNPAGFAILKERFEDGAIGAVGLAAAAALPTLVAVAAFQLLPG